MMSYDSFLLRASVDKGEPASFGQQESEKVASGTNEQLAVWFSVNVLGLTLVISQAERPYQVRVPPVLMLLNAQVDQLVVGLEYGLFDFGSTADPPALEEHTVLKVPEPNGAIIGCRIKLEGVGRVEEEACHMGLVSEGLDYLARLCAVHLEHCGRASDQEISVLAECGRGGVDEASGDVLSPPG